MGPPNWRLADALKTLRDQVDHVAPNRSKASDGTIGDQAHASSKSDHNPNEQGIVCAMDITHAPERGCSAGLLAEALRRGRDPRITYVIWNKRMFSSYAAKGYPPWAWRPYAGQNTHEKHVHISVAATRADERTEWAL